MNIKKKMFVEKEEHKYTLDVVMDRIMSALRFHLYEDEEELSDYLVDKENCYVVNINISIEVEDEL